jgi:hypothetical protein
MAKRYLLARYTEIETLRELHRLNEAARRLVRSDWAQMRIRWLADALLECGALSADRIYESIT